MLTQEIWDKFLDDVNNNNTINYTDSDDKILENNRWHLGLLCNLLGSYLEERSEILKILLEQGGLLDNQEEIPAAFFSFCELTDIKLPNTLTDICADAFSYCTNLKTLVIPKSVSYVGVDAFLGCKNLTIYCEVNSKPDGWISSSPWNSYWWNHWNPSGRPVYYKGEWEYVNGVPTPIKR